jgi:hypothetical protein
LHSNIDYVDIKHHGRQQAIIFGLAGAAPPANVPHDVRARWERRPVETGFLMVHAGMILQQALGLWVICALASLFAIRAAFRVDPAEAIGG